VLGFPELGFEAGVVVSGAGLGVWLGFVLGLPELGFEAGVVVSGAGLGVWLGFSELGFEAAAAGSGAGLTVGLGFAELGVDRGAAVSGGGLGVWLGFPVEWESGPSTPEDASGFGDPCSRVSLMTSFNGSGSSSLGRSSIVSLIMSRVRIGSVPRLCCFECFRLFGFTGSSSTASIGSFVPGPWPIPDSPICGRVGTFSN
jgi:hypothetical protein